MNLRIFFWAIGIVLLAAGCSTDVELNAPYKSTTVVFGLLDPRADTQWVKVNKTYLGKGNNLDYAQIRDSLEYRWEEFSRLAVEQLVNGVVVNEFPLQEKEITNKSLSGVFYGPRQTVYYFASPTGLNQDATYRLVCDFVNRPGVQAETNLVKANTLSFQIPQPNQFIVLAQTSGSGVSATYNNNVTVRWSPVENAELYALSLRFNYVEKRYSDLAHTDLVSEDPRTAEWSIGQFKSENIALQGGFLSVQFNAEPFFNYLGNTIPNDPYVMRQIGYFDGTRTRCFEVGMSIANEELRTYFEVNSPVTGVIQERPTYTNVSNGLGLFGSRSSATAGNLALTSPTQNGNLIALVLGTYTNTKNFCDPNPVSLYTCP